MTVLEQLERDLLTAKADAFAEGLRAAEDRITNWQGSSKLDPERKLQALFASVATACPNPYRYPDAVAE